MAGRLAIAAVAGVALAASVAGIGNEFVQDDVVLIAQNARVQNLADLPALLASPYWPPPWSEDLYRPLASLLLALQYALGGGGPLLFRIVSSLLYAGVAVAAYVLARRVLPPGIALGAALLFAAHPLHVEAVALGVAQNELLVALLAVTMVVRYVDRRRSGDGILRAGDWLVLGGLYLAGCLLKENGLVMPGLLVAAEVLLPGSAGRLPMRRLAPGYAFLAALGALVILARTAVLAGQLSGSFTAEALLGLSGPGRALTMLRVVPEWMRLLVWPAHLQADYSPGEIVASTGFGATELLGLALLLGAVSGAWLLRRRAPVCSFGLTWIGVALFPVSNVLIPTGIVLAERTLFLASIGAVLAVAGLVEAIVRRGAPVAARQALVLACGALVAGGVVRSTLRHRIWRNETAFTLQGAQDAPDSYRMQRAYGQTLFAMGNREAGVDAYRRAIQLAPPPHVWRVRNDLVRRLWEEGNYQEAVDQLRISLVEAPEQEETRNYLVLGLLALGKYADAAGQADSALARGGDPRTFGELRALADSAARDGAPAGSIRIRIVPAPSPPPR